MPPDRKVASLERGTLPPAAPPWGEDPLGRLHPATVLAAAWTLLALRRTRRRLRDGLAATRPPAPPPLPDGAWRGVVAVTCRLPCTCLERAIVLQGWLASRQQDHEVVIGVARDGTAFRAHAWLDFELDTLDGVTYAEIHRLPPR